MQGYQRRPCHNTPAPGGSDRYSLSMTAGPFCIRKAILIHEPINTDTSGFASATPPPLFGRLFSFFFFFFSFCAPSEKNSSKVLVLIRGISAVPGLMGETMEGQWAVARQPLMPGSYRGVLHQWPPIKRLSGHPQKEWPQPCVSEITRPTRLLHPEGPLSSMD